MAWPQPGCIKILNIGQHVISVYFHLLNESHCGRCVEKLLNSSALSLNSNRQTLALEHVSNVGLLRGSLDETCHCQLMVPHLQPC